MDFEQGCIWSEGGGNSADPRGGEMGEKVRENMNVLDGKKLICALNKFLITQPNKRKFD
jgi:hypothetical protein